MRGGRSEAKGPVGGYVQDALSGSGPLDCGGVHRDAHYRCGTRTISALRASPMTSSIPPSRSSVIAPSVGLSRAASASTPWAVAETDEGAQYVVQSWAMSRPTSCSSGKTAMPEGIGSRRLVA